VPVALLGALSQFCCTLPLAWLPTFLLFLYIFIHSGEEEIEFIWGERGIHIGYRGSRFLPGGRF